MKDGEIILLENTRYRAEETKNGDEFSKELASLCDVFVNDAFWVPAHRSTSLTLNRFGVTQILLDTAVCWISDAERNRFPRKRCKQS